MKRRRLHVLLVALAMTLCLAACVAPKPHVPKLKLVSAKPGTEVEVDQINGRQIADIHCPGGIGWAEFQLTEASRSEEVLFRLHLRGLEGCRFQHEGVETEIVVSSHGDGAIHQSRRGAGELAPGERIPVRLVPRSGAESVVPLEGWFEIGLPPGCEGNCLVRLSWVDFYR